MQAQSKDNFDPDLGWRAVNAESETQSDQRATFKGRLQSSAVLQSAPHASTPRREQAGEKEQPNTNRQLIHQGQSKGQ